MAGRNKLTEYREQLGYSQKDVGRSVDTDAGCICRYEREERYPNLEMALRLSTFYGVPVNELFELDNADRYRRA